MDALPSVVLLRPGAHGFEGLRSGAGQAWLAAHPNAQVWTAWPAETWPFIYPFELTLPSDPAIIFVPDLHEAFVNNQTAGTRLVTTQPRYLEQVWRNAIARQSILLMGVADTATLLEYASDLFHRESFEESAPATDIASRAEKARSCALPGQLAAEALTLLVQGMRAVDPAERLTLCVRALEHGRLAPALVATASACMEVNDLDAAARDLDEALQQAPNWGAAHFERGKLWLRLDDLPRAGRSFRAATELLPNFAPAWANLGATLGEIDRTEEALEAFQQALRCDPSSHQALNNIGVVSRELGDLPESEAAFRRVIELIPHLAFGYYNLGHTLFLQGRYQAALSAYVEGQKRDPERNAVQASRLALCRLAVGDGSGAIRELQRATNGLPSDYRQQLLADTNSIAWALLTHRPELPGWKQVNDWLSAELARQV